MRVALALVALLAVSQPAFAQSSVPLDSSASSPAAAQPASALLRLTPLGQIPLGPIRGNKAIYCCSEKGALIGAAIGAGLGFAMVYYLDDSGNRSDHYFTTAAVLGAVGAGVGAITGASNVTRPRIFPVGKRLGVGSVVSKDKTGGAVAVRF